MSCYVTGCTANEHRVGLCSRHYARLRQTGTTDDGPNARLPLAQRLWKRIERRGADECWPWTGAKKAGGYGGIWVGDGTIMRVHRVVWEQFNGPIPKHASHHGMVVMHTCDNRVCCNPSHLRLGTQKQNVRDRDGKGRHARLRGEANPYAKLTDDIVRIFRTSTKTRTQLAREYGCSISTVSLIRRGKRWKHVT